MQTTSVLLFVTTWEFVDNFLFLSEGNGPVLKVTCKERHGFDGSSLWSAFLDLQKPSLLIVGSDEPVSSCPVDEAD